MSEDKIYSFIGLARKAGAAAPGESSVENAVKYGKAHLVIVTHDASANTLKKTGSICASHDVRMVRFGLKNKMGEALGREMFSVVAITDRRFSERLNELINTFVDHAGTAHGGGFFEQTENS